MNCFDCASFYIWASYALSALALVISLGWAYVLWKRSR